MRTWPWLLLLGLVAATGTSTALATPSTALLRTPAVAVGAARALPKWQRVLDALERERSVYAACLRDERRCPGDAMRAWRRDAIALRGRARPALLAGVNRMINRVPYQPDLERWGQSDYWASPLEFLGGAGDCEDYAIAKYATLRELGVPETDMRLVVLQDTDRDLVHAVLLVEAGSERYVLDNLYDDVMTPEELPQYRPYYSVDARALWRHVPTTVAAAPHLDTGAAAPRR